MTFILPMHHLSARKEMRLNNTRDGSFRRGRITLGAEKEQTPTIALPTIGFFFASPVVGNAWGRAGNS